MARSRSLPAALTLRARIVLACDGQAKWRSRYMHHRIAGLYDELRPGRPRTVDDERVAELIATTLHTKPADGGTLDHEGVGRRTGISKSTVQRYLQAFNLKPHRVETFKLSTDPGVGSPETRACGAVRPCTRSTRGLTCIKPRHVALSTLESSQ